MSRYSLLLLAASCLAPLVSAQSSSEEPWYRSSLGGSESYKEFGRFSIGAGVSFTQSDIVVVDSSFDVPDDLQIDGLELSFDDELGLQSTALEVAVSYFLLPFLEVNGTVAYVISDSDFTVNISGEPTGDLPDLIDSIIGDEINLDIQPDANNTGVRYGFGAAAYLPIAKIGDHPLILRGGVQFSSSELSNISADTFTANLTLVRTFEAFDRDLRVGIGTVYVDFEREIDFEQTIGATTIAGSIIQELDQPWSLTSTVVFPMTEKTNLSFTTSQNFDGTSFYGLRVNRRF